jgi:hypothetical protein
MSKKIDRATHGPGPIEIVLGVLLSVVLGIVLGAVLLVLRPVVVEKEMPKEPVKGAVYYIEGSRDSSKAKQALAKRKAFVEGQSVSVTEAEINSLLASSTPPAAPSAATKGGDKAKTPEKGKAKEAPPGTAPASGETLAIGQANVRINGGELQVGVPVTLSALGLDQKVIVQARGGFVKKENGFVYEPSSLYFGSCPVQRLPFLADYVRNKALATQSIPEDIKTSWTKLANVSIEGNALKLTMP